MRPDIQRTLPALPREVRRAWYVVDAAGQVLWRLATRLATVLQGKVKPYYTPHVDCGDYVVVVNAKQVALTGDKWKTKHYIWHTGYQGHLRTITAGALRATRPERLITKAVWGMLPTGPLGRTMLKKLKVYAGPTHRHEGQTPIPFTELRFRWKGQ